MSKKKNTDTGSAGSSSGSDKAKKINDLNYYHYYLPREEAEVMLKESGDFLIRETVMADKRAAIVLSPLVAELNVSLRVSPKEVKQFLAEFNPKDSQFYFTEGIGKPKIAELVELHVEKNLPIRGFYLKNPVPRNKWEILEDSVQFLEKQLGEGNFAKVCLGKFMMGGKWMEVACKKLKMDRCHTKYDRDKAKLQILREFQIGRLLSGHGKILTVHGIFIASEELAVVMEFCDGGSLDRYIEKNQNRPVYEKTSYLLHASSGLAYMHRLNLIHRDVATRNFLVVKREKLNLLPLCKVSDFGLTRPGPVYKMVTETEVPYLISAPESMTVTDDPVWTIKSDCWSFGVLIWHIFEECRSEPYSEQMLMNGSQVREFLNKGQRLKAQADMPAELSKLMTECFNTDPDRRPTMGDIERRMTPLLKSVWDGRSAQNPTQ